MTGKADKELVDYRMEKSRESIAAAKVMVKEKMFAFAVNRIYYSMFYAVQALLGKRAISFSKHGQVKGYFNREFIKSGLLPRHDPLSRTPGPDLVYPLSSIPPRSRARAGRASPKY